jgi:AAA domain (dynein-related subfamily)
VVSLSPGIYVGDPDAFPDTQLDSISITDRPDGYARHGAGQPRFGDLDPVMACEVIAELTGMTEGTIVRFEEITRCPLDVQDSLLSERVMAIPELSGGDGTVFARQGFNVIAIANSRDRGVNEMSAALKRRFNFETVFPIAEGRDYFANFRIMLSRLVNTPRITANPVHLIAVLAAIRFPEPVNCQLTASPARRQVPLRHE